MNNLVTGRALGAERCLEPFGSVWVGCCCGRSVRGAAGINSPLVGKILVQEETDIRVGGRNRVELGDCLSFGREAHFRVWLHSSVEATSCRIKSFAQYMEMTFMTLQTEERLVLCQQVVGNGAMRIVTDGAVILNRGMAKHERTLITAVTVEAEVVGAFMSVQLAVWIVAVATAPIAFLGRML